MTDSGTTHPAESGRADRSDQAPVALVAGASRGLGLMVARDLARRGHRVVITGRSDHSLITARDQLAGEGLQVEARVHDVRDAEGAVDLVAEIEQTLGPVDTLIVVAGVLMVGPLPDRANAYDEPIDIMLRGPINMVHAVLPRMRSRDRGRIGIVTSIGGVIATPHLVPYSVAKFGAVGFGRGLTEELSGTGITVSTIIPGLMRTGGHWNGKYRGHASQEYAWFATLSSVPVVSIDVERAARLITRGVLRGRSMIVFTPLARVGIRLYGMAPDLFTRLLGLAGRFLPRPGGEEKRGHRAATRIRSRVFDRLTVLGDRAVACTNQRSAETETVDRDPQRG